MLRRRRSAVQSRRRICCGRRHGNCRRGLRWPYRLRGRRAAGRIVGVAIRRHGNRGRVGPRDARPLLLRRPARRRLRSAPFCAIPIASCASAGVANRIHAAAMQTVPAALISLPRLTFSTRSTILMASPPSFKRDMPAGPRTRAPMRRMRGTLPDASRPHISMLRVGSSASAVRRNRGQGIETANKRAGARNSATGRGPLARLQASRAQKKDSPFTGHPSCNLIPSRFDSSPYGLTRPLITPTNAKIPLQNMISGRCSGAVEEILHAPPPVLGVSARADLEELKQAQTIRERNRQRIIRIRTPGAGVSMGPLQ